jgi:hypothetical protein
MSGVGGSGRQKAGKSMPEKIGLILWRLAAIFRSGIVTAVWTMDGEGQLL